MQEIEIAEIAHMGHMPHGLLFLKEKFVLTSRLTSNVVVVCALLCFGLKFVINSISSRGKGNELRKRRRRVSALNHENNKRVN